MVKMDRRTISIVQKLSDKGLSAGRIVIELRKNGIEISRQTVRYHIDAEYRQRQKARCIGNHRLKEK